MQMGDVAGAIIWRVVAASVRGTGHEKTNLPCQDAHGWEDIEGGWLVAAVADGAGSAPLAQEGAEVAVRHVVKMTTNGVRKHLASGAEKHSVEAWRVLLKDN